MFEDTNVTCFKFDDYTLWLEFAKIYKITLYLTAAPSTICNEKNSHEDKCGIGDEEMSSREKLEIIGLEGI